MNWGGYPDRLEEMGPSYHPDNDPCADRDWEPEAWCGNDSYDDPWARKERAEYDAFHSRRNAYFDAHPDDEDYSQYPEIDDES